MTSSANAYIQIRIDRNVSIAAIGSLLVHLLILFLLSHYDLLNPHRPAAEDQTLDVVLAPPQVRIAPTPSEKPPSPPRRVRVPKIKLPPALPPARQHEINPVQAVPTPPPPPTPTPQQTLVPPKPTPPVAESFTDLASYMAAARERRRLAGDPGSINEEAAARERGPSEDEVRMANLRRNLQPSGTNGIFNVLSMNDQTATFDFRGWKNELSYARREVFQVEADRNTDVRHAMVRKMIEIIRRYYQGDFNWESPRLGQVVTLSARLQDNDFLEDFLLKEFFGTRGIIPQ